MIKKRPTLRDVVCAGAFVIDMGALAANLFVADRRGLTLNATIAILCNLLVAVVLVWARALIERYIALVDTKRSKHVAELEEVELHTTILAATMRAGLAPFPIAPITDHKQRN